VRQHLADRSFPECVRAVTADRLSFLAGPGKRTRSKILGPMIIPVLGGLLIADEVIDLFLPVLIYRLRLRRLVAVP